MRDKPLWRKSIDAKVLLVIVLTSAWATGSGCDQSIDDNIYSGGNARTVTVTYQEQPTIIDLSTLAPIIINGTTHVNLAEVLRQAIDETPLDTMTVDFFSTDGFTPGSKDFCTDLVPVSGALVEKGAIEIDTGNLTWDDELGWPGCMSVRSVGEIRVSSR